LLVLLAGLAVAAAQQIPLLLPLEGLVIRHLKTQAKEIMVVMAGRLLHRLLEEVAVEAVLMLLEKTEPQVQTVMVGMAQHLLLLALL
jgi:uncharacterized membrane protein